MAGNVKEWCWNQAAGGRMILGGGWNESSYKFVDLDAQPALQRAPERDSPGEECRAAAIRLVCGNPSAADTRLLERDAGG